MAQDFDTALANFVEGCNRVSSEYRRRMHPTLDDPKIEATTGGKKYVRVVREDPHRSVHCFVEIATGNVLKADGWSRPARGVRGNIYDEHNGLGRMGPYGPAYNR